MKIIHTDNYGGDWPNEKEVTELPYHYLSETDLNKICGIVNDAVGLDSRRFWKVVPDDYVLQPGFEP